MTNPYSFKPVQFTKVRRMITAPVAASVRKSNTRLVNIRIDAATAKRCGFAPGELITPFVDIANRAVLLLSGQRPLPAAARPIRSKGSAKSTTMEIDFPRADELAELFPSLPIRPMDMKEAGMGRLVFVVPNPAKSAADS